jgi:hypothetical protein
MPNSCSQALRPSANSLALKSGSSHARDSLFTTFTILGTFNAAWSWPGERRGGRTKGQPNKATIEKSIVAERVMQEAAMSGRKLGKETIEEFAVMFGSIAAAVQPVGTAPAGQVTKLDIDKWLGTKLEKASSDIRNLR